MSLRRLSLFTTVLTGFFAALAVMPQTVSATPRNYTFHIPVAAPDPVFTGRPEDLATPGWQSAYKASSFTNFTTRRADTEGTDAYVVFGKTGIYVAIACAQARAPITASQHTNDVGFGLDDYAGIMLDTTGSGELTYFFETTPNGTRYQQSSESTRYRPTWKTATSSDRHSWFAELFLPFDILRRGGSRAQHWRMNFFRRVAARQQQLTWAYNAGQTSPYDPNEWPSVSDIPIDLAARRARPNAEVYGLADFGGDRSAFEGSAGQLAMQAPRVAGIDAKIPITNLLNVVATLNPDFSNVENDQQLTTPQEFRRQYAEYRPFFTEGSSFLPSADVFYSPNVGVFNHGEKLEGELAGASVGFLSVTGYRTDTSAFQVRDMRDNDQLSVSVGGAFDSLPGESDRTVKASVGYLNEFSKAGAYGDYAIDRGTLVDAPGRGNNWDAGAYVARPNYSISAAYSDTGAQYAPIDGFVTQNDIRGYQINGSLSSSEGASKVVKSASVSAEDDRYLDGSGNVRLADDYVYGSITLRDKITFISAVEESELRSYASAYPSYVGGTSMPYDTSFVSLGYLQGTPHAAYASLTWGHFGNYYLQQTLGSAASPLSKRLSVTIDFQQSLQHFDSNAAPNGQILKRVSFFDSLSASESATLSYRVVSGTGGGAAPGSNLAIGYLKRTPHGNEIIIEIGSPAAPVSQNRFILKYVQLIGGGAGL